MLATLQAASEGERRTVVEDMLALLSSTEFYLIIERLLHDLSHTCSVESQ
jgi:hypothetical protein